MLAILTYCKSFHYFTLSETSLKHRRYNALSFCMLYSDSKCLLKKISDSMGNEDLLGKEFRNFINENRKAKNQTMKKVTNSDMGEGGIKCGIFPVTSF